MAMSGSVTVDTTVGGVTIINTAMGTRLLAVSNTGAATAYLKLDSSTTVLTTANGIPIIAGQTLIIGFNVGPNGPDVPMVLKGICATSTTIVAQTCPF